MQKIKFHFPLKAMAMKLPTAFLIAVLGIQLIVPAAVFADAPAKPVNPIKDKWAIVIGISDFADPAIPKLKYAGKDARDFYDYLIDPKAGKFAEDHVKLLVDKDATKVNILDVFGDTFLPRAVMPDDLVVIFISTHGSPASIDPNGASYIVAHDTEMRRMFSTGIDMNGLLRMLKDRLQKRTNRIVLILDTCYSAGAAKEHKGLERTNISAQSISQGIGSIVISSSRDDQRSWESDELQNGYFTRYLIDALKSDGGMIGIDQAFNSMKDRVQASVVRDKGQVQTPVMAKSMMGPGLVIGAPPTVARQAPVTLAFSASTTVGVNQGKSGISPSSLDFSEYAMHIREALKFYEKNKVWDAIHQLKQATEMNPDTIEGYLLSAKIFDDLDQYSDALEAARRAVVNGNSSSPAHEALGLAYLRVDNIAESLRQMQQAISLDPMNSMAHNWLGYINEHKFNKIDQAEQEYRKALELNNLNTRALVNLGLLLEKRGKDLDEVERLYRKAVSSDDDDWEAHLCLGRFLYSERSKFDEAESQLRLALQRAPQNATLHSELGNVLAFDRARLTDAESEFKKGILLAKTSATPHLMLAQFLLNRMGRVDEAERAYREAIQLNDSLADAHVGLAHLLVDRKKVYAESFEEFQKALKIDPKNASAHIGLAKVQRQLYKNYPAAREELEKAILISPQSSDAHNAMGCLLYQCMERYSEAEREFQLAIEADDKNADPYYNLGVLQMKQYQKYDAAKINLSKATNLNPLQSSYWTQLGTLLDEHYHLYKEGQDCYRKAVELNMLDTEAHFKLGVVLITRLNQRKAGEEELKTALKQDPENKEIKKIFDRYVR